MDIGFYAAKEHIADILEAVDTGIFIIDHRGTIIDVNSCWEKYTNINRQEIIGMNFAILLDKGYISYSISQEVLKQQKTVTKILNYKGENKKECNRYGNPSL